MRTLQRLALGAVAGGAAVAFVVVAAVACLSATGSPEPSKAPQTKDHGAASGQGHDKDPDGKLKKSWRQGPTDDPIAVYTFWLVIVTAVLALASIIQIGFLIHANRVATTTANAAKASADAFMSAERAHVLMMHINVQGIGPGADSPPTFTYELKNFGRTVARTRKICLDAKVVDERNSRDPSDIPGGRPESRAACTDFPYVIPPNAPFATFAPFTTGALEALTREEKGRLQNGEAFLFIYGRVEYRDLFEKDHVSGFGYCYRFNRGGSLRRFEPGGTPEDWKTT